jgi:hypothetical protein
MTLTHNGSTNSASPKPWESRLSYSVSSRSDGRRSPALDSVANPIKEHHSDLLISKQKLERAKGIELVRIKREQRTQDLCFSSRPFVLCGLASSQIT